VIAPTCTLATKCWLCGEDVEDTEHWLLKCPRQDKMLEVRARLIGECDELISAVFRPSDVEMAEGWAAKGPSVGAASCERIRMDTHELGYRARVHGKVDVRRWRPCDDHARQPLRKRKIMTTEVL
jgi:hypothetical protein